MAEKEYIERETAENVIDRFAGYLDDDMIFRIKYAIRKHIPAANVAPVRHGEWANEETAVTCTACGRSYDTDFEIKRNVIMNFKYCPKCGAKMDVGEGK